jgi:hypothetical protein
MATAAVKTTKSMSRMDEPKDTAGNKAGMATAFVPTMVTAKEC